MIDRGEKSILDKFVIIVSHKINDHDPDTTRLVFFTFKKKSFYLTHFVLLLSQFKFDPPSLPVISFLILTNKSTFYMSLFLKSASCFCLMH